MKNVGTLQFVFNVFQQDFRTRTPLLNRKCAALDVPEGQAVKGMDEQRKIRCNDLHLRLSNTRRKRMRRVLHFEKQFFTEQLWLNSTIIHCVLFVRKLKKIYLHTYYVIPFALILCIIIPWSPLSKAFAKPVSSFVYFSCIRDHFIVK